MNRCAKFDAASFILGGEIRNCTNKHTQKKTVNDISTPCLSACVDNKPAIVNSNFVSSAAILRTRPNICVVFDYSPLAICAIRYVLLVLQMKSCFHIMERMGQNQRRRVCFVQFARWRHRGRSHSSPTASSLKTPAFIQKTSCIAGSVVKQERGTCW